MVLTPRVRVIIKKVLNFNKNNHAGHLVGLEQGLPAMTGSGQVPWANTKTGYNKRNIKTKTKMRFSVPLIILAEIILFARGPKKNMKFMTHCQNSLDPSFLTQVLGTAGHERVGEEFLEGVGFPREVTQFVRGHVQVVLVWYFSHSIRNWHKSQEGHSMFVVDKTK